MASLADFDLLSFVGYDGGGGLELIFASSAVLGGVLFLLWFALMMIGGIAADVFDGIFGTDFDAMGADASFKALTFQGIMAFMMFFGLGGLYVLEGDSDQTSLAIVVGSLTGFASMYGTGKLFQLFVSLAIYRDGIPPALVVRHFCVRKRKCQLQSMFYVQRTQ